MIFKNQKEIEILKESGRRLAAVLDKVIEKVAPDVTPEELDKFAERLIREGGDAPAFLGYTPSGALKPYPATLCVSVNNQVVHTIPSDISLKEGDIVGVDIGLFHKDIATDMARTIAVGKVDEDAEKLMCVTEEALHCGIREARAGGHTGDIGYAIEKHVSEKEFSIVRQLGGHGIGRSIHEDPFVHNFGKKGTGALLHENEAIAIEPIVNEGAPGILLDKDGYTYLTTDGKRSAHFEHTVLITKGEPVIITKI